MLSDIKETPWIPSTANTFAFAQDLVMASSSNKDLYGSIYILHVYKSNFLFYLIFSISPIISSDWYTWKSSEHIGNSTGS